MRAEATPCAHHVCEGMAVCLIDGAWARVREAQRRTDAAYRKTFWVVYLLVVAMGVGAVVW